MPSEPPEPIAIADYTLVDQSLLGAFLLELFLVKHGIDVDSAREGALCDRPVIVDRVGEVVQIRDAHGLRDGQEHFVDATVLRVGEPLVAVGAHVEGELVVAAPVELVAGYIAEQKQRMALVVVLQGIPADLRAPYHYRIVQHRAGALGIAVELVEQEPDSVTVVAVEGLVVI